jgi:hypothetical protein
VPVPIARRKQESLLLLARQLSDFDLRRSEGALRSTDQVVRTPRRIPSYPAALDQFLTTFQASDI